jgi:hypothetical protein
MGRHYAALPDVDEGESDLLAIKELAAEKFGSGALPRSR